MSHSILKGGIGVLLGLAAATVISFTAFTPLVTGATSNLVANNSFETSTASSATGWAPVRWGSSTAAFSIKNEGQSGGKSAYVQVSNYKNGDAKWEPAITAVAGGTKLQFSDWYKSSVATEVNAEITLTNGKVQYVWLANAAASSTTWKKLATTITLPANAKSIRVYHLIAKNGWLQTDNYELSDAVATPTVAPTVSAMPTPSATKTPTPSATAVPTKTPTPSATVTPVPTVAPTATPKPSATPVPTAVPTASPSVTPKPSATPVPTAVPTVTPTPTATPVPTVAPTVTPVPSTTPTPSANLILNPSMESGDATTIMNWVASYWGTLTPVFSVNTAGAQNGTRSATVTVTAYTDGDAKWVSDSVTVLPNTTYTFSDYYKATAGTQLDAAITDTAGVTTYTWLGDLPAATAWTKASATITTPANASKMTIFHLIYSNGTLEIDNASLTTGTPVVTPTPTPTPTTTPTPSSTPTPSPGAHAPFSRPLASIEFDDGWTSAYINGLPIVRSFGWVPTQYIITDTAANNANYGAGTYMTPAQIKDWVAKGGDIGSHTVDHSDLATLTQAQVTAQLSTSKSYLETLLNRKVNLFATPLCSANATVTAAAKLFYQDLRNCDSSTNFKASFDAYNVQDINILSTTTDAEIISILNAAKANNGWVDFTWHMVGGTAGDTYNVTPAQFTHQLQLIKDSGITVLSTQEALNESQGK